MAQSTSALVLPATGLPSLPALQLTPVTPGAQAALAAAHQQAGPQLDAQTPPWRRPGAVNGPQHQPAWPQRPANWFIPLAFASHLTLDLNTRQDGVNFFLHHLNGQFGGVHAAAAQGHTGPSSGRARHGPVVFDRELSTHTVQNRHMTFDSYADPQRPNRRMFGSLPLPAGMAAMRLADYSATVVDAINGIRLTQGTLYMMASREVPAQLRYHTTVTRFLLAAGIPQPQHASYIQQNQRPNLPNLPDVHTDLWHNTGLFIQSRNDFPVDHGPRPGTHSWENWTFDGTQRWVYIYDSAYVNESMPARLVTAAFAQHGPRGPSRLQDHVFHSTTHYFLYGPNGLATANGHGRARWIRWQRLAPSEPPTQGCTVWIGGGGNTGGVDECRRMTANWMMQVAWLSRQLSRAIYYFQSAQDARTERAFRDAWREWKLFFAEYTAVRA